MTLRRVFTAGWVDVLGAASLVLSGGCGDDAAGTPSGSISGGGPTIEQLPALIAKVLCDQQQTCLGAAYQKFLRGQDFVANATRSIEDGDIGASRKPRPGLATQAARELSFDVSQAFVIGDKAIDVNLAAGLGASGILVRTGYGAATERNATCDPNFVVDDLNAAADVILLSVDH